MSDSSMTLDAFLRPGMGAVKGGLVLLIGAPDPMDDVPALERELR